MEKKSSDKLLLVDHDIVVFQYASTCEFNAQWSPEVSSKIIQLEQAKVGIENFIIKLMKRCKCNSVKLFMTGDYNFRYGVLPSYKHNREETVRPVALDALREWSMENYDCQISKGFEADDLLGIYGSADPDNTVVATIDKDLRNIPCTLYLWHHDKLERVSLEDADRFFYYQILIGDTTDGYTGCPGCGPKTANKLLDETPRDAWWPMILDQYEKAACKAEKGVDNPKLKPKTRLSHCNTLDLMTVAGGSAEYALAQARVARICRWEDHNPKTMEVKLWKP